jgi:hypothetical protein
MKARTLAAAVALCVMLPSVPARAAGQDRRDARRTTGAADLRRDMRKLWTDHVVWTRDYIIAATTNQPDATAALNRLMKNQEDIGNAVAQYYGPNAGRQLTMLLKDHIAIAGDIVKAAMTNNTAGVKSGDDRWHQNATQIADFLSKANPNWPRATLVDMMNKHLSTTTDELMARLHKDWDADVRAYDAVYDHILMMADALSDGIVKQFPEKFGGKASPTATSGSKY